MAFMPDILQLRQNSTNRDEAGGKKFHYRVKIRLPGWASRTQRDELDDHKALASAQASITLYRIV
jgi:hypothetical protein